MDMIKNLTKDTEYAIAWLSAEFKFLKKLYDDLERIENETIGEQEKDLKKDIMVVRFIGKSEKRAERDVLTILEKIKEERKKTTSPEKLNKLLLEIEFPANQLVKEGSLYVGRLKEQLNSIRTNVALEEKYPTEETRAIVQQEIDKLKNKVRHVMVLIAALDAALRKVEKTLTAESFHELELRIRKADTLHSRMITFNADTEKLAEAYNRAINHICNEQMKWSFYHQIGKNNSPGEHGWEDHLRKSMGLSLENIFSQIHRYARKFYEED